MKLTKFEHCRQDFLKQLDSVVAQDNKFLQVFAKEGKTDPHIAEQLAWHGKRFSLAFDLLEKLKSFDYEC